MIFCARAKSAMAKASRGSVLSISTNVCFFVSRCSFGVETVNHRVKGHEFITCREVIGYVNAIKRCGHFGARLHPSQRITSK